jgi:hypothetical protein
VNVNTIHFSCWKFWIACSSTSTILVKQKYERIASPSRPLTRRGPWRADGVRCNAAAGQPTGHGVALPLPGTMLPLCLLFHGGLGAAVGNPVTGGRYRWFAGQGGGTRHMCWCARMARATTVCTRAGKLYSSYPMLIRMNLDGGWELGPMAKATNFCTSGVSCWRGLAYALPITLYPRGCQMEAHEEATPLLLSFDSWNRFWGIIWPGLHSHAGPDEYFAIDAFDCVLLVDAIYQTALLLWCWWNTGIIVSSHGWWMWEGDSDAWGHWHQSWLN